MKNLKLQILDDIKEYLESQGFVCDKVDFNTSLTKDLRLDGLELSELFALLGKTYQVEKLLNIFIWDSFEKTTIEELAYAVIKATIFEAMTEHLETNNFKNGQKITLRTEFTKDLSMGVMDVASMYGKMITKFNAAPGHVAIVRLADVGGMLEVLTRK